MYYRVAIQVDAPPPWKWHSTALSELSTLLQWLRVSPGGGTLEVGASQTLTISVTPTGLSKSTYSGTLQIIDGTYSATIYVTLKVFCFYNGEAC
jgi:hypothetical protein